MSVKRDSVFCSLKEIFENESSADPVPTMFGMGEPNPPEYSRYFIGESYVNMMVAPNKRSNCLAANVTFEPGCQNNWHTHPTGQLLFVTNGRSWYQEWSQLARERHPGDFVNIPPNAKHWHGASKGSWFAHLATEADAQHMEDANPSDYIAKPVDLGLSVKWASFNIGASRPEE